jgi:integrase/recombinase XerC
MASVICDSSIDQFLKYAQNVRRYSSHTINAYRADLQQFAKHYQGCIISADRKDIRGFLLWLRSNGYTARTANRKLEVLKSFYRYHIKFSGLKESPCQLIQSLRYSSPRGTFIQVDTFNNILNNIDHRNSRKLLRDRLILEILYFTGCRATEIINLKKAKIDYNKMQLKITGKGNYERIAVVSPAIIEMIKLYNKKWKHINKTPFLFNNDKGKKIYPMFLWRLIRAYYKPSELGHNTSAHVIRHSIATHLYHNRAPLHSIKTFLGHRSLKTTVIYLHFDIQHLIRVHNSAHPKNR